MSHLLNQDYNDNTKVTNIMKRVAITFLIPISLVLLSCSPQSKSLPIGIFNIEDIKSKHSSPNSDSHQKETSTKIQIIEKSFNYKLNNLTIAIIYLEKNYPSIDEAQTAFNKDIPQRPAKRITTDRFSFARNQYAGWILTGRTLAYCITMHPTKSWRSLSPNEIARYQAVIDDYMKNWLGASKNS